MQGSMLPSHVLTDTWCAGAAYCLQVEPWSLQWPEGTSGRRDFTVTLVAAPEHGVLTGRLSNPSGEAVVHPSAAAVEVVVQSPVVSFTTNLVSIRGSLGAARQVSCTCLLACTHACAAALPASSSHAKAPTAHIAATPLQVLVPASSRALADPCWRDAVVACRATTGV